MKGPLGFMGIFALSLTGYAHACSSDTEIPRLFHPQDITTADYDTTSRFDAFLENMSQAQMDAVEQVHLIHLDIQALFPPDTVLSDIFKTGQLDLDACFPAFIEVDFSERTPPFVVERTELKFVTAGEGESRQKRIFWFGSPVNSRGHLKLVISPDGSVRGNWRAEQGRFGVSPVHKTAHAIIEYGDFYIDLSDDVAVPEEPDGGQP